MKVAKFSKYGGFGNVMCFIWRKVSKVFPQSKVILIINKSLADYNRENACVGLRSVGRLG